MNTETRIAQLEADMAEVKAQLATLTSHRAVDTGGAGDYAADVAEIRNAMQAQGWRTMPTNTTLVHAREAGVPVATIIEHFDTVARQHGTTMSHVVNVLRLDPSLYPYLLDGTGIGYVPWLATPAEQQALFSFTQTDVDAAATEARTRGLEVTDYMLYRDSGGQLGIKPLGHDKRGASSDDTWGRE